jgi:hypothetical protein
MPQDAGQVYYKAQKCSPKFAFVNVAASQTASSLVAAVAAKKILVISYMIMAGSAATDVTFNSGSTAISCLHACPARSGVSREGAEAGYFITNLGEALTVTTSAGSTCGIMVSYIEVNG